MKAWMRLRPVAQSLGGQVTPLEVQLFKKGDTIVLRIKVDVGPTPKYLDIWVLESDLEAFTNDPKILTEELEDIQCQDDDNLDDLLG